MEECWSSSGFGQQMLQHAALGLFEPGLNFTPVFSLEELQVEEQLGLQAELLTGVLMVGILGFQLIDFKPWQQILLSHFSRPPRMGCSHLITFTCHG